MVKGINKRIIEIKNTDNIYFEKAILFVRQEKDYCSYNDLSEQASLFLEKVSYPGKSLGDKKKIILTVFLSVLFTSIAVSGIFCLLFL